MASTAPSVVLIDRALIRALLRYMRRLERQFDLLPPGHPAIAMPEMIAKAVADAVAKAEDAVTFSTTHASRSASCRLHDQKIHGARSAANGARHV